MKKILLMLFTVFSAVGLFSQSQRTLLLEEFTQASCPPCETTTPALNAIVSSNAEKLVQIRYQTSWPGVDPMNADNPEEVATRVAYYGVTGVPNLLVDGVDTGSPGTVTQAQLDAPYATESPIAVSVSHMLSDDLSTVTASVTITNEGTEAYDMGSDKLRVALVEEEVTWPTPPGSTSLVVFEAVMKTFFTTPEGMDLPAIAPGETFEMSWEDVAAPGVVYDFRTLAVVAFVQDDVTRAIMNAATSEPQELEGFADLGITSSAQAGGGLCDFAFTGSATVVNATTADAEGGYTVAMAVNGDVVQAVEFEETIAGGASVDVQFEEIDLPAGTSNIQFAVQASGGDIATLNNITGGVVVGKAGAEVTELEKGYESQFAGALPDGAIVDRPFDLLNFIVINREALQLPTSIGGFGESENSVMINFWNWNPTDLPAGGGMIIGERYMVPAAGADLVFDHAFTTWGGSNDELRIEVSTDCGESFTEEWAQSGSTLATAPELMANDAYYTPAADEWRTNRVDLSAYSDQTILVRFAVTSGWGDMLYIDNVKMEMSTEVVEISDNASVEISPNPASTFANIDLNVTDNSNVTIQVVDMVGQLISQQSLGNVNGQRNISYDVSDLANGTYLFKVIAGNEFITQKVTVVK